MSFDSLGLAEPLLRAVHEQGYTVPTPIQAQAIPAVLSGGDLLAGDEAVSGGIVWRAAAAQCAGRAVGIGCGAKNTGVGNGIVEYGKAILRPEADGTVTLFHSWTEMGQGCHTALQQIACQELSLDASKVRVVVDTMRELDTGQTTASRSTVLGGRAIIEAAMKLIEGTARSMGVDVTN